MGGKGVLLTAGPERFLTAGPERFAEVAAGFPECRAVVLGDVMLDRYVEGQTSRVSPEAPVPVVRIEREWDALGGAGNVAANVRALGARCDLVGATGDDDAGRAIRRALEAAGARCDFVRVADRPTTVKTRVLAQGQQVVRVDREEDAPHSPEVGATLLARLGERLPDAHILILADYDKGAITAEVAQGAVIAAAGLGVPVVVDPKRRNFFAYRGASVFKPNKSELEVALGELSRPNDAEWMNAARRRVGCGHLLLTLGADGMALCSPGGALDRVQVGARSVYDVSGAGDTVAAVVAVSLAAGAAMAESVRWAAHAAAVGLATAGVATVAPQQIRASLSEEQETREE